MNDKDTFQHEGHTFTLHLAPDECNGPPWKEEDGHGVVSEWTTRDKHPGERTLCSDRSSKRFYDWQATMKIAKQDGWGPSPVEAVEADFKRLRAWCNSEWYYMVIGVEFRDRTEWLGGVESDSDYYMKVAHDLADELLAPFLEELEFTQLARVLAAPLLGVSA
jgi:hypothetical protein